MERPEDDRHLLLSLEFLARRAREDVATLMDKLAAAQSRQEHAEALLEAEKERAGPSLNIAIAGRFTGKTFGEAAREVVRDANGHEISADKIAEILRRNGVAMKEGQKPGRAIHAAFINADDIERTGRARYKWRKELAETA